MPTRRRAVLAAMLLCALAWLALGAHQLRNSAARRRAAPRASVGHGGTGTDLMIGDQHAATTAIRRRPPAAAEGNRARGPSRFHRHGLAAHSDYVHLQSLYLHNALPSTAPATTVVADALPSSTARR